MQAVEARRGDAVGFGAGWGKWQLHDNFCAMHKKFVDGGETVFYNDFAALR